MKRGETQMKMLAEWLRDARQAVVFTGAGMSTESGLPDFRSAQSGIWQGKDPTQLASTQALQHNREGFAAFYRMRIEGLLACRPHEGHAILAEWERRGRIRGIITQNVDGFHQQAGSRRVLELHGSVHRNTCMECGRTYTLKDVMDSEDVVPRCSCGGIIKPDVVLYGESLDDQVIQDTVTAIARADLLVIGGTSLTVQPAAHLVTYFRGERTVLINASSTAYDNRADLLITEPIGEVLGAVARKLGLSE